MSQSGDQSSADVAAAAEHERADLAETLDKLRENLQPRNVVDEVMSHAGVNPGTISDQLATFAKTNPVATALIGIGAAMFFGTKRGIGGVARAVRARPTPAGRYPDAAIDDADGPYALRFSKAASEPFGARQPMNAVTILRHPQSSLSRLIDEQPLVLAAVGVAVGATIGALLPPTTMESQLMGDANEAMRRNAKAAARAQMTQLRTAATDTFSQMKATVAEHGATSENLYGLVHDLGDDVRSASQAIGVRSPEDRTRG